MERIFTVCRGPAKEAAPFPSSCCLAVVGLVVVLVVVAPTRTTKKPTESDCGLPEAAAAAAVEAAPESDGRQLLAWCMQTSL